MARQHPGAAFAVAFLLALVAALGAQPLDTIFYDDFTSNSKAWAEQDDTSALLHVTAGRYVLESRRPGQMWNSWAATQIDPKRDFDIDCVIEKERGSSEGTYYGLMWGVRDENNCYYFAVSNDGRYLVGRADSGSMVRVASDSAGVVMPGNATNRLSVSRRGDSVSYFVNGGLVASSRFDSLDGKAIGIMATDTTRVALRRILVAQPANPGQPVPADWMTVFHETFADNSGKWPERNDDTVELAVKNGRYVFELKQPGRSWNTRSEADISRMYDFDVSATMTKVSGVDDNGYGLVWGFDDGGRGYRLLVSGDGHYKVAGREADSSRVVIPWTQSPFIRKGNARNKLSVRKTGDTLCLYVNDRYLNQMPCPSLPGTSIGFALDGQIRIEATELLARQPPHRMRPQH